MAEKSFNNLKETVVGIWLADGSHDYHDTLTCDAEYVFKDFLRGWAKELNGIGGVKFIECEGGGEGGAEDCHSVIQVGGVYFKVFYTYRSHEGYDWDYANAIVVNPVDRVVTFYE